jgi:RimJ/RimL family protein N-acetyltransferase
MGMRESDAERKVMFLNAERINLRRLSHQDVGDQYLAMLSDPVVTKYLTVGKFPLSLADLDSYVSSFDGNQKAVALAIIEKAGDQFVGTTTLNAINWISGTADVGMSIGAQYIGEGYPAEVLGALVPYAFDILGLRRLYMGILRPDSERIEAAREAGFVEEGVWREHSLVDGKYEDEIWFGIIQTR